MLLATGEKSQDKTQESRESRARVLETRERQKLERLGVLICKSLRFEAYKMQSAVKSTMNRVHGFVLTNSTPPSPAVCQGVGVSAQRDRNWSYSIRQSGSEWFSSGFT